MRVHVRRLLLVCAILVLLLPTLSINAQDQGVTLRIGTTLMIDTLNPGNGFYGYAVRPLWYDTLVSYLGGDQVGPGLAESWSVSPDGKTWTFKIRSGVKFQDGTPLTAVEAAWNINWILQNQVPAMISYLNNVTGAKAIDATTLEIDLSQPVPDMISAKLIYVWMLPPSVWKDKTGDDITNYADLPATMGSGPYKLTDYKEGEYMTMVANPDYWGGKPTVDKIIYQQYANEDALTQALIGGDIDLIIVAPASGVAALQKAPNVKVSIADAFSLEELIINSSPDGTQPKSLNDPKVRLAIAHAIDKQTINTVAYLGHATVANTFLPTAMTKFHDSAIQDDSFDLAAANKILDDAGYKDTDGDGIREWSDGSPLQYRLYAPTSDAYYARVIQIISDDLKQIGIDAPPQTMDDDSMTALQKDYDDDLMYWGWNFDPDPSFALSIFTCAETEDGGWSDSGYCNKDYDALYQQESTTVDPTKRADLINQLQQKIFDDKPYIPVVYPQAISAYRSDRFTFADNLAILNTPYALTHGFSVVGATGTS
ncbi:MAG TPA: ABC transporter substrate-binding protein [Phototrophicaceae bacterium]|nr:ABC transporter substrate-binding protein [Phototrophicaceae bacterium]